MKKILIRSFSIMLTVFLFTSGSIINAEAKEPLIVTVGEDEIIITDVENFKKYNDPSSSIYTQHLDLVSPASNKKIKVILMIMAGITYVAGEIVDGVIRAFVDFEAMGYNVTTRILNFARGNPTVDRIYYNRDTGRISGGGFGGGGSGSWALRPNMFKN